jgi:hypothetical protein
LNAEPLAAHGGGAAIASQWSLDSASLVNPGRLHLALLSFINF